MLSTDYGVMLTLNIPTPALSVTQQDIQGFMASLHGLTGKNWISCCTVRLKDGSIISFRMVAQSPMPDGAC